MNGVLRWLSPQLSRSAEPSSVGVHNCQTMSSIPFRQWFWLIAVWIPFPCLFLPFTLMKEDYDPWYIDYTSPVSILAVLFYTPANFLTTHVPMMLGYDPSIRAFHLAAFIQSLILSYFVLRTGRRKADDQDFRQP